MGCNASLYRLQFGEIAAIASEAYSQERAEMAVLRRNNSLGGEPLRGRAGTILPNNSKNPLEKHDAPKPSC